MSINVNVTKTFRQFQNYNLRNYYCQRKYKAGKLSITLFKSLTSLFQGYDVELEYLEGEDTFMAGWIESDKHYSVVGLKINLRSDYHKFVYIYYIPTIMFTVTSWVSFIIPPSSYPARKVSLFNIAF